MSTGKVWLVGAGPGDIGLLTRKAEQVIREADLIVYDALIGSGIFSLLPKDAEYISVGKRSGNHTMPQEQIDQVLLEEAQKGKKVVRLKGGDPFLFGRGVYWLRSESGGILPATVRWTSCFSQSSVGITCPIDFRYLAWPIASLSRFHAAFTASGGRWEVSSLKNAWRFLSSLASSSSLSQRSLSMYAGTERVWIANPLKRQ